MSISNESSLFRTPCLSCGRTPGARAYLLEVMNAHDDVVDENTYVTSVNGTSESVAEFCNKDCWKKGAPSVIDAWELVRTFPSEGPEVPCGRCSTLIDRRKGYVLVSLSDEEFIGGIGKQLQQHAVWDFAILCRTCGLSLKSMTELHRENDEHSNRSPKVEVETSL